MKQKLCNYSLKLGIYIFFIISAFNSCERDYIADESINIQESRIKRITLSELNNKISNSPSYNQLASIFDVNRFKTNLNHNRPTTSDNPYLSTDEIIMIVNGNTTFYTFRIESDLTGDEFYNLVVAVDEFNTILSTRILEYIPSSIWLQDTSQPFEGHVKAYDNDLFSITSLSSSLSSRASGLCVTDVTNDWECTGGWDPVPNPPGIECQGWEYVITVIWGPCPTTIDDGDSGGGGFPIGGDNPGGTTGGGTNGSGSPSDQDDTPDLTDETAVIKPNKDLDNDCEKLKNNLSDDDTIKNKLHQLTLVDGQFEKGLRLDKNPNTGAYQSSPIFEPTNGARNVFVPINQYTAVISHCHPDVTSTQNINFEMYSGVDILKMGAIVDLVLNDQSQNPTTVSLTEITHVLVTQDKYYALRFDDVASAMKLRDIFINKNLYDKFTKKLFLDYMSDIINSPTNSSSSSIDDQIKHIYNIFAENGLNMTLYKAETDNDNKITDWKKINKQTRNTEPCE